MDKSESLPRSWWMVLSFLQLAGILVVCLNMICRLPASVPISHSGLFRAKARTDCVVESYQVMFLRVRICPYFRDSWDLSHPCVQMDRERQKRITLSGLCKDTLQTYMWHPTVPFCVCSVHCACGRPSARIWQGESGSEIQAILHLHN